MDVKHKRVWLRLKLFGKTDPIDIESDGGFVKNLQALMVELMKAPNRYGPGSIEFQFEPFDTHLSDFEKFKREVMSGIDMSMVHQATDEEEELIRLHTEESPLSRKSEAYDPLYEQYVFCGNPVNRATKTPEDLALLRKHVEARYSGTQWWDGEHKW